MAEPVSIVIAGGKTGGHLFPGIAVAQALQQMRPETRILFVGTDSAFETDTLIRYGFDHRAITITGIKGKSIFSKLASLARIPLSLIQTVRILRRNRPDLALGVGGYASGPVVLAARFSGIPTAIQEQNTIPGITNRLLSPWVQRVFTGFPDTRGLSGRPTALCTGNPIRKGLPSDIRIPTPIAERPHRFTLLVTGGSQGASRMNQAMTEAVAAMPDPGAYRIIHQTGSHDEAAIRARYRSMDAPVTARAFFHDMQELFKTADLILCRAGAGTLSEITALGKPAILVPFPHAADDHQTHNALTLVRRGAAEMIPDAELEGRRLLDAIERYRRQPEILEKMASASRSMGTPRAAETIAREILNLILKGK